MVNVVKVVKFNGMSAHFNYDGRKMPIGVNVLPMKELADIAFRFKWSIQGIDVSVSRAIIGEVLVTLIFDEGGVPVPKESVTVAVQKKKHEDAVNLRPVKKVKAVPAKSEEK